MQSHTEKEKTRSVRAGDQSYVSHITCMGLLLALALILSYVEVLIPFWSGVPGVKLGLANLAVVLCLYLTGWKDALFLTVAKALLAGLLFGNLFMIFYSLTGALVSALVMILLKRAGGFHLPVVSAAGGVAHNMGQLLVALFAVKTYGLLYYTPVLLVAGMFTGILIGITASLVLPYIQHMKGYIK